MLASSLPSSFTGVPDFCETKHVAGNSSKPIICPGHHDPFGRWTQTRPPTVASIPLQSIFLELSISLSVPLSFFSSHSEHWSFQPQKCFDTTRKASQHSSSVEGNADRENRRKKERRSSS